MVFEILFEWWVPVAVLILFITLTFISLIYMVARALENDNFKKWAQNEIYQVFASALIIGSLFIFLAIINNITLNLIPLIAPNLDFQCSGDSCTFNTLKITAESIRSQSGVKFESVQKECKQGYCHIEVANSLLGQYYDIIRFYLGNKISAIGWISVISSFKMQLLGFHVSPFSGLTPILDIYKNFITFGTNLLILIKVNQLFLVFTSVALFPMFLIAGIALRSISLLRGVGGLLLSIAIGSFFVYPFLLLLSFSIVSPNPNSNVIYLSDDSGFVTDLPSLDSGIQENQIEWLSSKSSYTSIVDSVKKVAQFSINLFNMIVNIKGNIGGQEVSTDFISYMFFSSILPNGFLDNMAFLSMWMFVPFIISIYSLLVFIKEFSSFLGGDIDIAGLSKLI
ncbi:MAG: hypothetical protein QXO35_00190 [Candidatus Micrarchaeia archaeon]